MNINNANAISYHLGKSHSSIDNDDNALNERNDGFASVSQNTASNGRNDSSTGTKRSRSANVAEGGAEGGAGVGLAELILGLTAEDIQNDTAPSRRILSSFRPGVSTLSHPTNGGTTMMLLTENDGSISNPRNDISEGRAREGARTRVREVTTNEDKRGDLLQESVGNHQEDNESQVSMDVGSHVDAFDLDDQLLAVAFRGWIDELDIYERKGCRFLKRKRSSV